MALTDVSFDLTQNAPKAASTGYTRAIREGLKEEAYVKFREVFVKKVIKTPLSSNLQVSSYKASEMDNKENFFHAISGFTHASLQMEAWMRTHFVKNVFIIQEIQVTDATKNPPIRGVIEVGDLFKIWNTLTLKQVYESCQIYLNYSTSAVEAQNLNLSWEFIMANIDNDLCAAILAEVSEYMDINPDLAQSGPMAFFVIANRIIRASDALAHNVVTGIMGMGLVHFKDENVVSCVAVLRNVLLFLGHGTARSKAPPTIMDTLIDVFLRCSNVVFVNNLRNTRNFHRSTIDTLEKLFSHVQSY